jgi:zinc transporter 9
MLIGTALCVIIPEGVFTTLNAHGGGHSHDHAEGVVDSALDAMEDFKEKGRRILGEEHGHDKAGLPPAANYIGLALLLGFVFMMVVDRIGSGEGHGHSHGQGDENQNTDEEGVGHEDDVELEPLTASTQSGSTHSGSAHDEPAHVSSHASPKVRSNTDMAMLGICVHAAVDGVALGAISSSANKSLEMVVFVAIMMHKAPAAFGIASFLLSKGKSKGEIVRMLLCFSVAAPATALLTYVTSAMHVFSHRPESALSN